VPHHEQIPNTRQRSLYLTACEQNKDLIEDLMNETPRIRRLFPTVASKKSQMERSAAHIRFMFDETYWELNERFELLGYLNTATAGETYARNNY